ncbi:SRPBCC family protein [bacterium]|nr:SRPBCC family protein [bacterium]
MTKLENSIIINADLEKIYQLAQAVEKYPEFIPEYKESKIIGRENGKIIIARAALINQHLMRWKSKVWFSPNKSIEFEQIEGKLKGMQVKWTFEQIPGGTKVTILHLFKLNIPLIGWFLEKLVARPRIEKTARNVLISLKKRIEQIGY